MKLEMSQPAIPPPRGNQLWDEADILKDDKDRDGRGRVPEGKTWTTGSCKPEAQPYP